MQALRHIVAALALFAAQQASAHTPAYFGFAPKVEFTEASAGATAKYVRAITFTDVDAGSPAAKAGVRAGDAVLELDAMPLAKWSAARFDRYVHGLKPGKRLRLKLRHADGQVADVVIVGAKQ